MTLVLLVAGTPAERANVEHFVSAGHVDGVLLISSHESEPLLDSLLAAGDTHGVLRHPARTRSATFPTVSVDEVGLRPDHDALPARAGPPPHRDDRRAGTTPPAAATAWSGSARRWASEFDVRPRRGGRLQRGVRRGGDDADARAHARHRRGVRGIRSHGRRARSPRCARRDCGFRRTSRWRASTTPGSRRRMIRRSPRCASRGTRSASRWSSLLLEVIAGAPQRTITLPTTLVVRESA